jgi:hypothetical protein
MSTVIQAIMFTLWLFLFLSTLSLIGAVRSRRPTAFALFDCQIRLHRACSSSHHTSDAAKVAPKPRNLMKVCRLQGHTSSTIANLTMEPGGSQSTPHTALPLFLLLEYANSLTPRLGLQTSGARVASLNFLCRLSLTSPHLACCSPRAIPAPAAGYIRLTSYCSSNVLTPYSSSTFGDL